MALFRRDVKRLEDGITVWDFFSALPKQVMLFSAVGLLLQDHVAACEQARHLGNNATVNDRSCWVRKSERTDAKLDLWDHSIMRRRDQTDVVGDMIRDEAWTKVDGKHERARVRDVRAALAGDADGKAPHVVDEPTESVLKKCRGKYGIYETLDAFAGSGIDTWLLANLNTCSNLV